MADNDVIPVVVTGATGRMGRETVGRVLQQVDMKLVAAVGHARHLGTDIGQLSTGEPCGVVVTDQLEPALELVAGTGVLVDFSVGSAVKETVLTAFRHKVACVVGTTGVPATDENELAQAAAGQHLLVSPNFALGAVLMMRFAREAAQYFKWAEIVELHHERKLDAPSGTAMRTAEQMRKSRPDGFRTAGEGQEHLKGSRGGNLGGVRIHSVRMPGLVAHQEVIFGGAGETLTIRHDAYARESYMPGVVLAIQRVRRVNGMVVGLENVLDL
ncbi:MAG: 4-hydroxy-tetrahydrodipicolinate reductase [Candidatus Eremiobacterota bacterium]